MIEPLCRRLEIARVDVAHIAEINQANQSFHGKVFLILRIREGAEPLSSRVSLSTRTVSQHSALLPNGITTRFISPMRRI